MYRKWAETKLHVENNLSIYCYSGNVTIGKLIKCFLKHIDWNLNVLTWKPQQTTF